VTVATLRKVAHIFDEFPLLVLQNPNNLQVIQGHRKWHDSIDHTTLPINGLYNACSARIQFIMNLLTVGCNACARDGERMPTSRFLVTTTAHTVDDFFLNSKGSHFSLTKKNKFYSILLELCSLAISNDKDNLIHSFISPQNVIAKKQNKSRT